MKLEAFLKPRSIAVIGASRNPEKVGHIIFRNLINSGYEGDLYPINPNTTELLGRKCYRSVMDVKGDIDLAIIAVPAKIVPTVARECGEKGVKGLVVISAGFSETGREGTKLEKQLVSICREYGMRLQGPNCLGIINTHSHMNASFTSANPRLGRTAFISQSGALGSVILNWANRNRVGFTSFISLGNEADLTAADFIEALADDEETKVIALYIEGVKDGERFVKICRKTTKKKPIIALKAGTTDVGMRAVSSHTGSLAGSDIAFSAAFRKAGVIRVYTLEELFNLVLAFEDQPIPRGRNVLIITNGGGPGILAADACEKMDLELPLLESNLIEELRNFLPPQASLHNPLDVLGDADEERYKLAVYAGLKSERVDALIIIVTPQAMTPVDKIAEVVVNARKKFLEKPVLAVFMGIDDDSSSIQRLRENGIPNYHFPECAAHVLRAMYDYNLTLKVKPEEPPKISNVKDKFVKEILINARKRGRLNLTIDELMGVAKAYGIPVPKYAIAKSRREAGRIADTIGYPVAMKIVSPEIIHKTDVGGVILNINSRQEVEENYNKIIRRVRISMPEAKISGVLIQQMAPPGKEVIVGAVRDPYFGPLIMFGLGGIYVDFLRDVSYRLCPLTRSEALKMIEETKAYMLLRGVRGEPPSDIESVIDVILRVSQIMTQFKEIVEMEINPLCVYERGKGCLAIDIRVTVSSR